jgi:hypothetical protein
MDCLEFRRVLDLYVDGELSAEALAAASRHRSECSSCRRTEEELHRLRQKVQETVSRYQPPADLRKRIEAALSGSRRRLAASVVAIAVLLLVSWAAASWTPAGRLWLASGLEQVAFELDQPQTLVLEGEIVCRECELFALYGSPMQRDLRGHRGALKTESGKIWNFMEDPTADPLVHDESLLGKRVRVRARLFRRAGCLQVESYEILRPT